MLPNRAFLAVKNAAHGNFKLAHESVVFEGHCARQRVIHTADGVAREKKYDCEFDDLKFAHFDLEVHL